VTPAELVAILEEEHEQLTKKHGLSTASFLGDLSLLLYLKAAQATGFEDELPEVHRWADLARRDGTDQFDFYRTLLIYLGSQGSRRTQAMFSGASSSLPEAKSLGRIVTHLEQADWYDLCEDDARTFATFLLDLYVQAVRRPDQQPTPTPLVDCLVRLLAPQFDETVQDPACGSGGFLVGVQRYLQPDIWSQSDEVAAFRMGRALSGLELRPEIYRVCTVHLLLYRVRGEVALGDTLSPDGAALPKAHVILTNPPFGNQGGGKRPSRSDLTFPTSSKQFAFLQHIYRSLFPGGRAAMVVPDDVLFEANEGPQIRADLMDKCDLHTILRLPSGIWAKGNTRTNVLFFRRGPEDQGNHTQAVWVYDMRAGAPSFGKRTPLTLEHFRDFVDCYGSDPNGASPRVDQGAEGRWRRFTREEIRDGGDRLDLSWLPDESVTQADELPEPSQVADDIIEHLEVALREMRGLSELLETPSSTKSQ
jgi:type I restriction enzyme M protein